MNIEDRINFYLGNLLQFEKFTLTNSCHNLRTFESLNQQETLYDNNLRNLLIETNNSDKIFSYVFGDNENTDTDIYTIVKNRCNDKNNSVILRCLEFHRHWSPYYNKPIDIPYEKKKNKVFWRGTTTGNENRKGNRFDLVTKWMNIDKDIDVGFSFICQRKDKYNKFVKGDCNMNHFLKYKYIISVEGNDKDSGINWKLNSNSLVLMPKPRITSWLMETTLIPNFHYVLLKDDFSDLKDKLNWCNANQSICKNIILNANNYMKQFSDINKEEQIEKDVINKYFSIIESNL